MTSREQIAEDLGPSYSVSKIRDRIDGRGKRIETAGVVFSILHISTPFETRELTPSSHPIKKNTAEVLSRVKKVSAEESYTRIELTVTMRNDRGNDREAVGNLSSPRPTTRSTARTRAAGESQPSNKSTVSSIGPRGGTHCKADWAIRVRGSGGVPCVRNTCTHPSRSAAPTRGRVLAAVGTVQSGDRRRRRARRCQHATQPRRHGPEYSHQENIL
jgi:hypothetical protein